MIFKMFYIKWILNIWNGLIEFILFEVEKFEDRTIFWNKLCFNRKKHELISKIKQAKE